MITMGIDPGVKNYAIVAINDRKRVIFARLLRSTVRSMSMHAAQQRPRYRGVIRRILEHVRPDEVMVETFVARGFGTVLTELVNVMIGSLMSECDHLNVQEHATMASSWKNSVGQHYAWPDYRAPASPKKRTAAATQHLYAWGHAHRVPDHLVDALLLATYLRHGKTMNGVDWAQVRDNVVRISRLAPLSNLISEKRKRPHAVSSRTERRRRRDLPARGVLDVERTRQRRVRRPPRGKREPRGV